MRIEHVYAARAPGSVHIHRDSIAHVLAPLITLRLQHNVASEVKARRKQTQNRSLLVALYYSNENFKPVLPTVGTLGNKVLASAVVMLRFDLRIYKNASYLQAYV